MTTVRQAGYIGIVFVAGLVLTAILPGSPADLDDPATEIRGYLADHRTGLAATAAVQMITAVVFLWFVSVLHRIVIRATDGHTLGIVVLSAGILTTGISLVATALGVAPVYFDGFAESLGDDTIRLVYATEGLVYATLAAPLFAFAAAVTLAAFRNPMFPTVVTWAGVLASATSLAGGLAVFDPDLTVLSYIGFIGFAVFVSVLATTMAFEQVSDAPAQPGAV